MEQHLLQLLKHQIKLSVFLHYFSSMETCSFSFFLAAFVIKSHVGINHDMLSSCIAPFFKAIVAWWREPQCRQLLCGLDLLMLSLECPDVLLIWHERHMWNTSIQLKLPLEFQNAHSVQLILSLFLQSGSHPNHYVVDSCLQCNGVTEMLRLA